MVVVDVLKCSCSQGQGPLAQSGVVITSHHLPFRTWVPHVPSYIDFTTVAVNAEECVAPLILNGQLYATLYG
jgi:hypothetical protein